MRITIVSGARPNFMKIAPICRAIDAARLVLCEESGGEWDIDCNFENCDYAHSCPIGRQIAALLEREGGTPA